MEAAREILSTRYAGADSLLLAGSITRGEATATSDLDLVVLFPNLPRSFRESFVHRGWPVDVFAHDEETIEYYFLEQDLTSGVGAMLWMVHDGIPVPGNDGTERAHQGARSGVAGRRSAAVVDGQDGLLEIHDHRVAGRSDGAAQRR